MLLAIVLSVVCSCSYGPSTNSPGSSGVDQPYSGATVEIGLPYPTNLAGLGAIFGGSMGAGGASAPSGQQVQGFVQAIVDYVNKQGGVLGKKITPVFFGVDATTAAGSTVEQAMCTQFTQDHHVFAAMALPNHSDSLVSCLQQANAITFDPVGSIAIDDSGFDQHPLYATAGALSLTRVAAAEANGLFQQGFFGTNAKIGLIGYNTEPFTRAIDQALKPALAAHGLTVADQQLLKPVGGIADVGPTQQEIGDAVLRFKSEGIDHVLFFDTQGGTVTPWSQAANAQQYYPRLGLTTNQIPSSQSYVGNQRNPGQVKEFSTALGVGWDTVVDVQNPPVDATGDLCTKLIQGAGGSAAQARMFWGTCDQLLVFAAGVNAGGKLTPAAALAGLGKATNLPSAELTGSPNYSNGRRDGAAVARFLAFQQGCQCFQYDSGPVSLSSLGKS